MPRKMQTIRDDFEAAVADARRLHDDPSALVKDVADADAKVPSLMTELSQAITLGADDCPECGTTPHGLRHTHGRGIPAQVRPAAVGDKPASVQEITVNGASGPETRQVVVERASDVRFTHHYEIGCLTCLKKAKATTPEEKDGAQLEQYGEDARKRAVEKWNRGEYEGA